MLIKNAKDIILDKVKTLPTIPAVIHQLVRLMHDSDVDVARLVEVISYDLAISSRLLKVANSAYYGCMRKVATVRHAITVLGLREVKSLALGIAVFEATQGMGSRSNIERKDLWLHSIGAAMAARMLSRTTRRADPETAFTACLLHDIGKLILDAFFNKEYRQVIEATPPGGEMFAAEERILGFAHSEVGGWLCEFWKLPPELFSPIMHHHHLERVEGAFENLAAVVQCADFICKCSGIGYGGHRLHAIKVEPRAVPSDAQENSLEKVLESKRNGQTKNSLSVTVALPHKAIEILNADEESLNLVLQDLGREKDKACSFVNAVS